MLKRARKRIRKNSGKLLAALGAAVVLAGNLPLAAAADNPVSISSGSIDINYDIFNSAGTALTVSSGASATMANHSITNSGGGTTYGAYARSGGRINLSHVTVNSSGSSWSVGVTSESLGSNIVMQGGRITANSSATSIGAWAISYGTIRLTDVDIIAIGSVDGVGLYASSGNGQITMTNGSINSSRYGVLAIYINTAVNLRNTSITAGLYALGANQSRIDVDVDGQNITAPLLMNIIDGGIINLTASGGSHLYGRTDILGSGTANLTLNNGAVWTIPATSQLTALNLNSGGVNFATPANPAVAGSYGSLNIVNFAGSGGTIRMNGNLAAGYADRLNITGGASGSQLIVVYNYGGNSASPYGTVKVATVAAGSTATFGGGGDIGSYRYGIAPGSALSSAYTVGGVAISHSPTDYYLYNTFGPSTPVQLSLNANTAGNVMWYGEMNEIRKRMGDLRMGRQSSDDFWVRTYGRQVFRHAGRRYEVRADRTRR